MGWLDRIERKIGKFAIKNLMIYITGLNALVGIFTYFAFSTQNAANVGNAIFKLYLIPSLVMQGEVWRLVTFLFIPPDSSPVWLLFTLYFSFWFLLLLRG